MERNLKHKIEIIPSVASNISLFNLLYSKSWRKLKRDLFKEEGNKCWICGKEGVKLEAHEFWDFDYKTSTHKLIGIHHLCIHCHGVKHITYWLGVFKRKEREMSFGFITNLRKQFLKINNCSEEDLEEHIRESRIKKEKIDNLDIKVDFGEYDKFISRLRKKAIVEMMREMREK